MDDLKPREFDVAQFIRDVTAGAGDGRISSAVAARSASNVERATGALREFDSRLRTDAGEVLRTYLRLSPGAVQLFAPLWLAERHGALAGIALDVLVRIARLAKAHEPARAIAKDVVKARATNVAHVVRSGRPALARKVLVLLTVTANVHFVLAKQVATRFELAAPHFARALTQPRSMATRAAFIRLTATLLAAGDHDVLRHLATSARQVLVHCAAAVEHIAANPIAAPRIATGNKRVRVQPTNYDGDHVSASLAFVHALCDHVLSCPNDATVRSAFEPPLIDHLVTVAVTELPIFTGSEQEAATKPQSALKLRKNLRAVCAKLLLLVGKNRKAIKPITLARALSSVPVTQSPNALKFVLDFVESCPHVAASLLQVGPFLPSQARVSSAWLSNAAVIMACTKRLERPVDAFMKYQFFERVLKNESRLVQHMGILLLAMLCRIVENSKGLVESAMDFLPGFALLKKILPNFHGDAAALSVLASYQALFPKKITEAKLDPVRMSVEMAGSDITVAEATIRSCLSYSTEATLTTIFQKKLTSSLLKASWSQSSSCERTSMLVKDIIKATNLVSKNRDHEIDIWVSSLEAQGEERDQCLENFEDLLFKSWKQPYPLFDLVAEVSTSKSKADLSDQKASLLTAAALRRISNRKSEDLNSFEKCLVCVVSALTSWEFIVGQETTKHLVLNKLSNPASIGISLLESKKTRKNIQEAVSCLQRLESAAENSVSPRLRELCLIGEFLSKIHSDQNCLTLPKLSTIWTECCAEIGVYPAQVPLGVQFFSKCSRRLAKHTTDVSRIVEGLLRLLCVRSLQNGNIQNRNTTEESQLEIVDVLMSESMSSLDRCLLVGVFLQTVVDQNYRDKALSVAMKILCDMRLSLDNQEIASFLCESVLVAVQSSHQIPEKYVEDFLTNVIASFEQLETACSREQQVALAYPVMHIFEALVNHCGQASGEIMSRALDRLDRKKQLAFARLGGSACRPYLTVLKNVPASVPGAVQLVLDLIEKEQLWSHPADYLPILCFISGLPERRKELDNTLLMKMVLVNVWMVPIGHPDTETILEAAYQLGTNVGKQSPLKAVFEKILEVGPNEERGAASVWWAAASGLLSRSSRSTWTQDELLKAARSLMKLTAQQITDSGLFSINQAQKGPLGVIRMLLDIAPFPTGHVQHHTEEFEDIKNFCAFISSVFKEIGVSSLQALRDSSSLQDSGAEVRLLNNLSTILECAERIVGVQELAVNLSRLLLHSFGEFSDCFVSFGDRTRKRTDKISTSSTAVLMSFVRIVVKSVKSLQAIGMDSRSATALTKLEEIFCDPSFCFTGSTSEFDRCVIEAMTAIKACLQKDDLRRERGLPNKRSGFFAPLAANVIPTLNSERLEATSVFVLKQLESSDKQNETNDLFISSDKESVNPYEPEAILKRLRLGSEYAAYSKKTAVLDLGAVVNSGLLRVAISSITSNSDELRLQAYAALDALSRAVGPEFGHSQQSAATLFRDRRQLAFMLQVLKDSVDEPMKQVLPLFSSWFWHALRVLRRPTHGAHSAVMRYLLRQPLLDVNDCEGVVHLLRSTETGVDVKATRLLALDIIEDGIWSRQDHLVARRRKIYEIVLMLAGSSLGIDATVRDKAIRVLAQLPLRLPGGQISIQLCRMHSLSSFLVPQHTDPVENRLVHLMLRVDVLASVASSLPDEYDQVHHALSLAETLRLIVQAVEYVVRHQLDVKDVSRVINCATSISRLAPKMKSIHTLNFKWLEEQIKVASMDRAYKNKLCRSLALAKT